MFKLSGTIDGAPSWLRWDAGKLTASSQRAHDIATLAFGAAHGVAYGLRPSQTSRTASHLASEGSSWLILNEVFDETPTLTAGESGAFVWEEGAVY